MRFNIMGIMDWVTNFRRESYTYLLALIVHRTIAEGWQSDPWGNMSFSVVKTFGHCPGHANFWDETTLQIDDTKVNLTELRHKQMIILHPYLSICSHVTGRDSSGESWENSREDEDLVSQEQDQSVQPRFLNWPEGQYCVLKTSNRNCPPGLAEGSVKLNVRITQVIPGRSLKADFVYGPNSTRIYFCCNDTGKVSTPISLPPTKYIGLFTNDGNRCQRIAGMTQFVTGIKLYSDEENMFANVRKYTSEPVAGYDKLNDKRDLVLYMCGYKREETAGIGKKSVLVIVGIVVGGLAAILTLAWTTHTCHLRRERRRRIKELLTRSSLRGGDCYAQDTKVLCDEFMQTDQKSAYLSLLLSSILDTNVKEQLQPLLIPRATIEMQEKIGTGAFGSVFRARYLPNGDIMDTRLIAVKMIKDREDYIAEAMRQLDGPNFYIKTHNDLIYHPVNKVQVLARSLLDKETCSNDEIALIIGEALLMSEVSHPNVMSLLGVSVEGEFGLPVLLMPLMHNGDLLSYLRRFRYDDKFKDTTLSTEQLLVFGYQVARGMEYLASMKIVHRDLATRNCMVSDTLVVKVADFGLARDMYSTSYYRQSQDVRLPVKWLALESLEDRVFTSHSDVWSYGITLWEILTLGKTPYPSLDNCDVFAYVKHGRRLDQPEKCPDNIYKLMTSCWSVSPICRPNFTELAETIEKHVTQAAGYLEVEADQIMSLTNRDPQEKRKYGTVLGLNRPADFEDQQPINSEKLDCSFSMIDIDNSDNLTCPSPSQQGVEMSKE